MMMTSMCRNLQVIQLVISDYLGGIYTLSQTICQAFLPKFSQFVHDCKVTFRYGRFIEVYMDVKLNLGGFL